MGYILSLKGKRIRPVLTLLAYQAVTNQSPESALNLASSVELFHNFTLMHDDIMDRAPVRRGMPSVHVKWDEDIAILSGDALFAFSMGLVVKDFPSKAGKLAGEFSKVAMEVCEGQMEDMDLATKTNVSIEEYLEMIRKKTAALLGGCMSLGAIAGGASSSTVESFRNYGQQLGLAFQLQDDLMDAFPPEGFGKQVGGDIIENKKTYLYLKALELASSDDRKHLEELFVSNNLQEDQKVSETLEIFQRLDIPKHTRNLINSYFEQAKTTSVKLAESTQFGALQAYLKEIVDRQF
ncbi:UNVERIFIED_CONTAM: hypothetical protein GTU68_022486 [Idotea baltica]|nr:hypothetical protein [Idotea baltica]